MAVIPAPSAPTHELGGARFTSLATPSRGSSDTSVWLVEIGPGTPGTLASGGSIPFLNVASALEVSAAFVLLFSEFLDELVVRPEARSQ